MMRIAFFWTREIFWMLVLLAQLVMIGQ
jgi:hypothetical protein